MYCQSAINEHQNLLEAVEEEMLGAAKTKIRKILLARSMSTRAPWLKGRRVGRRSGGLSARLPRPQSGSSACVAPRSRKERKVRKTGNGKIKVRRVSAYNAFTQYTMILGCSPNLAWLIKLRTGAQQVKVGSEAWKTQNAECAKRWSLMGAEERSHLSAVQRSSPWQERSLRSFRSLQRRKRRKMLQGSPRPSKSV